MTHLFAYVYKHDSCICYAPIEYYVPGSEHHLLREIQLLVPHTCQGSPTHGYVLTTSMLILYYVTNLPQRCNFGGIGRGEDFWEMCGEVFEDFSLSFLVRAVQLNMPDTGLFSFTT